MTHSFQPTFKQTTPDSKITAFGPNLTIESLLNTLEISGTETLLSADNPRVLWCADSEAGDLCNKAQIVLSTEGLSLGFTGVDQRTVLIDNKINKHFNKNFLSQKVTVYVTTAKVYLVMLYRLYLVSISPGHR